MKGDSLSKKIIENLDEGIAAKIEECVSESNRSEVPEKKEVKRNESE